MFFYGHPIFRSNSRQTDFAVLLNRYIERCLRESRPVDMESLCIIAGEKVNSKCFASFSFLLFFRPYGGTLSNDFRIGFYLYFS